MNDILLINKPSGITSYDVIRRLKNRFPGVKLGHAGTLDPLASGLMIVGVGACTKKLKDLIGLPKTYKAVVCIGKKTSTGDRDGKVIEEIHPKVITHKDVKKAIKGLHGIVRLPIPLYSAVKYKGRRLYERARKGEKVEQPYGDMEIHSISLLDLKKDDSYYFATFQMEVGSGTYVRSVAEEIGRRLGYPATVAELTRTQIGAYSLSEAESL